MLQRRRLLLSFIVSLAAVSASFAQELYITNEAKGTLELLNLGGGTISTLYTIGAKPDDLIVNAAGQLLYTLPTPGTVDLYDPITGVNSVLVTGVKYARDLMIEPGGETMLIALETGQIIRFNFVTGTSAILIKKLGACDGIAYDAYGNLFAVANHNTIVQIDPVTGAVLATLVLEPHYRTNGADGMTYDPYTGSLWATHNGTTGNGLIEIPTSATGFTPAGFNLHLLNPNFGIDPDGIKSDGKGNLYVGAIWTSFVYNIPTNTITEHFIVNTADGVSLVPGTY
ncbi:MAG TPA: hypothetical protein VIW68_13785 [Candidatus Sulfotelmatobacter sp.]